MSGELDPKKLLEGTTPGPWVRRPSHYSVESKKGRLVASAWGPTETAAKANARLIAAAPELAAELLRLREGGSVTRFEFSLAAFDRSGVPDCPVGTRVGKDALSAWCVVHRKSHPVDIDGEVKP